jgi:hypothetical protein
MEKSYKIKSSGEVLNKNSVIEVYSVDTGKTSRQSLLDFFTEFGENEGLEILEGYSPNIVAVAV